MIGIIDAGGGLRDAFGAGVLDYCTKNEITFDHCFGVSAGAGNLVSFLAGQYGRNLRFYLDYPERPEYMSLKNLVKKKTYLDMDYIYSGLTNEDGDDPLDYNAFSSNPTAFTVVATDADTGLPVYFTKDDFQRNNYFPLKASSSIPIICKAYEHDGHSYFDGGVTDPIPFEHAFKEGCDKLVVIITRPKDFKREGKADSTYVKMLAAKHPRAAKALKFRYAVYNYQMKELLEAEKEGKVLILAPESVDGMWMLTKNPATLQKLYWEGYIAAEKIKDFLK